MEVIISTRTHTTTIHARERASAIESQGMGQYQLGIRTVTRSARERESTGKCQGEGQ